MRWEIVRASGLLTEVGGGIRTEETVKKYLDAGVFRVILGTGAGPVKLHIRTGKQAITRDIRADDGFHTQPCGTGA